MFESMIGKIGKGKDIHWDNPKYLYMTLEGDEKETACELYKGASSFLHKKIDIKPGTSKEVYKKSENIWKQLKDLQLEKVRDNPNPNAAFWLDKPYLVYMLDQYNNVVDIYDAIDKESYDKVVDRLEKFKIDVTTTEKTKKFYTDGSYGMVKLICYDKDVNLLDEPFTPVVFIEFNNVKSVYTVYTGILLYDIFTFLPTISAYLEYDSYINFILNFDLNKALDYSKENAQDLYNTYLKFKDAGHEISVREVISLLRKVGYKLELKDDNQMDVIAKISDTENSEKIANFFNTFSLTTGETAYDILSLSELKKMFRYNKLTILDMITILSKEYMTYDGSKITTEILCNLVYKLYDRKDDKNQTDSIKNEIKE